MYLVVHRINRAISSAGHITVEIGTRWRCG